MATTIMGRLAVRPRQAGGGYLIEDRDTGAVLAVWDLRVALSLAAAMAPRLAAGESLAVAYSAAETQMARARA